MIATAARFQSVGSHITYRSTSSPGAMSASTRESALAPQNLLFWCRESGCAIRTLHPSPAMRTASACPSPTFAIVASACGNSPGPVPEDTVQRECPLCGIHTARRESKNRHSNCNPSVTETETAVAIVAMSAIVQTPASSPMRAPCSCGASQSHAALEHGVLALASVVSALREEVAA